MRVCRMLPTGCPDVACRVHRSRALSGWRARCCVGASACGATSVLPVSGRTRQAGFGAASMKDLKICAGSAAAGGFLHRRGIVIADPDAADQIGGEADEPGIVEILRGAGLAGAGPFVEPRRLAGAGGHGLDHQLRSSAASFSGDITRPSARRVALVQHFARLGADARRCRRASRLAAIGEGRHRRRSVPAASRRRCPAPATTLPPAARRCPAGARSARRCWGPTSAVSCAATTLEDFAKARVSVIVAFDICLR